MAGVRFRILGRRLIPLWLSLAALATAAAPAADLGAAIYRDGLGATGAPLRGMLRSGVTLDGAAAACANCHRRSGLGGSEGQVAVRPIAGRGLAAAAQDTLQRRWAGPAGAAAARAGYDIESLARALRDGVDPAGRPLDPLMPRYALSQVEVAALHAYLEGLSSRPAPGIGDREIHLATIISPEVEPQRRRAMLDVLEAFVRDKNGGTRQEARRRAAGHEQMYFAYRHWVLHVWDLRGAPETWERQLDAFYREQPVFAVIGGAGGVQWQPVHAFCEAQALPCVFPDVDGAPEEGAGYYSLYFSRGIALEADLLATELRRTQLPGGARVVQVFRDDQRGRASALSLRQALQRRGLDGVADHRIEGSAPLDPGMWSQLLHGGVPTVVVAWLSAADLGSLAAAGPPPANLLALYVPGSAAPIEQGSQLPAAWLERARLVSLFEPPARRRQHLARIGSWLSARRIAPGDARAQASAFLAATVAGEALSHLGENFSRDYFVERIEQMVESAPVSSVYPRLSLGPGQRFGSRGGYIMGFPPGSAGTAVPLSGWVVP